MKFKLSKIYIKLLVWYSLISSLFFLYNAFFKTSDSDKYFLAYFFLIGHLFLNSLNFYSLRLYSKNSSLWYHVIIIILSIVISSLILNIFFMELVLYLRGIKPFLLNLYSLFSIFSIIGIMIIGINILIILWAFINLFFSKMDKFKNE